MDITITISGKVEEKLSELAERDGKNVSEVAVGLLEEKIEEEYSDSVEDENPFIPFIGMFSSGKTDTSERIQEILYEADLDPAEGFSGK